MLPPLFLHFTFFFPERPRSWATSPSGSRLWPVVYLPALLLGAARITAIARAVSNGQFYIGGVVQALDRFEPLYLSVYLGAGLVVIARAFREVRTVTSQRPVALDCVGHRARAGCPSRSATLCRTRWGSCRRCRWSCRPCP